MEDTVLEPEDMQWLDAPIGTGAKLAILKTDRDTGGITALVKVAKGWQVEEHRHTANESSYLIAGEIEYGDRTIGAGTFWYNPKGNPHGPFKAKKDSVFLASFDGPPFENTPQ